MPDLLLFPISLDARTYKRQERILDGKFQKSTPNRKLTNRALHSEGEDETNPINLMKMISWTLILLSYPFIALEPQMNVFWTKNDQ